MFLKIILNNVFLQEINEKEAAKECPNRKGPIACEPEVEKDVAFSLGLLAVKPKHQ